MYDSFQQQEVVKQAQSAAQDKAKELLKQQELEKQRAQYFRDMKDRQEQAYQRQEREVREYLEKLEAEKVQEGECPFCDQKKGD